LLEETAHDLRKAAAPRFIVGTALCNFARARVEQGRLDEPLDLLEEGLSMRPDLRPMFQADPDLSVFEK